MVEILTVLGIMSMLTAALIPLAGRNIQEAQGARAVSEMQGIRNAVVDFYNDTGWYPHLNRNTMQGRLL